MFNIIRILILPGFLSLNAGLFSQSLSHQVLVPVAGVSSSGSISYSQTIGETAVEIIHCSDYEFTQGFQQPSIKFVPVIFPEGNGVDVYPNPAFDNITVRLFGSTSREFLIEIISITGKVVLSEKQSFPENFYLEKVIPVKDYYRGFYFVRILSTDRVINRTFKIEKL